MLSYTRRLALQLQHKGVRVAAVDLGEHSAAAASSTSIALEWALQLRTRGMKVNHLVSETPTFMMNVHDAWHTAVP